MTFALRAGDLFQLHNGGEFEDTIISKCVDQYIALSVTHHQLPSEKQPNGSAELAISFAPVADEIAAAANLISPTTPFSQNALPSKSLLSRQNTENLLESTNLKSGRSDSLPASADRSTQRALQAIIERLFENCLAEGRYRQVVGIAVEARNLDIIRGVIKRASEDEQKSKKSEDAVGQTEELMEYVLDICMGVVQERALRTQILKLILELLNDIPTPDYFAIAKCVVYLNQDAEAATILRKLVQKGDTNKSSLAVAYQIAFDLYDNGTQEFLSKVRQALPGDSKQAATSE